MPSLPLSDPFQWFQHWYDQALDSSEPEPTAMSLATVTHDGQPTVRIVLLKHFDRKGFVFYTNLKSAKGRQLHRHPRAGLCILWKSLGRQIRIDGPVEPIADAEADAYFASRPRGSQIGAWASRQSEALDDRQTLLERVARYEQQFADQPVPRPEFWSGFRLVPHRIEFWQLGDHRLHDRWEFTQSTDDDAWTRQRLYP